jgi:hypothetical protein
VMGARVRTAASDVSQHTEDHQRGHDDHQRGSSARPMVHRIERMPLSPVCPGSLSPVLGGSTAVAVPRPGIVEDQGVPRIGKRFGSPHRNGRNRSVRPRGQRVVSGITSVSALTHQRGIALGHSTAVEPGAQARIAGWIGRSRGVGRRPVGPVGEMLEGPQGRVVAANRMQIVATGPPNDRGHKGANGDQYHYGQNDPHPDHSTRRGSQSCSQAQFSTFGGCRDPPGALTQIAVTEVRPPSTVR